MGEAEGRGGGGGGCGCSGSPGWCMRSMDPGAVNTTTAAEPQHNKLRIYTADALRFLYALREACQHQEDDHWAPA